MVSSHHNGPDGPMLRKSVFAILSPKKTRQTGVPDRTSHWIRRLDGCIERRLNVASLLLHGQSQQPVHFWFSLGWQLCSREQFSVQLSSPRVDNVSLLQGTASASQGFRCDRTVIKLTIFPFTERNKTAALLC